MAPQLISELVSDSRGLFTTTLAVVTLVDRTVLWAQIPGDLR